MKIENTVVLGFESALYGMRNPMNSWGKCDSVYYTDGGFKVGVNDNTLAKKLIKAGGEHRKFLRMIHVHAFLTLPRYIWTEWDTYKVSTVRNSCSTMHKLGSVDLTTDDFQDNMILTETLFRINLLGKQYRESKEVSILREMKQILPEGFLQSSSISMSYENAINMYHQRKNHRMNEWSGESGICKWIESLPMMNEWLHL